MHTYYSQFYITVFSELPSFAIMVSQEIVFPFCEHMMQVQLWWKKTACSMSSAVFVFACIQVTISSACFAFMLCMSKVPGPYFWAFYIQCQNNAEFFARGLLQSFGLGQVQTKGLCSLRTLGLFRYDMRCRPSICVMVALLLKPDCSLESR